MAADSEKANTILEVLNRHFEAEARADVEATLETITDDCHYEFPFHGLVLDGRDEMAEFYPYFFENSPVISTEVTRHWLVGDDAMFAECQCAAMVEGVEMTTPLLVFARVRDGRMCDEHVYFGFPSPFLEEYKAGR